MGVCLLMPCAFLVLGSSLLDVLFPDCYSQTVWIIFMALTVVPVSLIPTMKESTGMAVAGCLGTIVADIVGIAILFREMRGHPSPPTANASPHQVVTTFGNLSLAYAAATVVPDLQRQHSQPERMPRVIVVSLGLASAFFVAVAVCGYALGGCQMSGNLLFSIVNTSDPYAVTTLGFTANRGAVVMAFLFMQMHLAVAFSTLLHPAFYMFERMILGMHAPGTPGKKEETTSYRPASTPAELEQNSRVSRPQGLSRVSATNTMVPGEDLSEYKGRANVLRYILLRITVIALLVLLSILLRDHFLDLVDFTGATAITMSSLVVPLVLYNKVFWKEIPIWEKIMCVTVAVICTIAGFYVMVFSGKNLFNPGDKGATFPYCSVEFQEEPYYVVGDITA
uniref:Amino acid transporter transmembrane domain-containing protein n=1 Tax=Hyaloperonospora arabidopsidis (strain Emoy2) TaxID=559515 RepID=M4C3V6_HYAAE